MKHVQRSISKRKPYLCWQHNNLIYDNNATYDTKLGEMKCPFILEVSIKRPLSKAVGNLALQRHSSTIVSVIA